MIPTQTNEYSGKASNAHMCFDISGIKQHSKGSPHLSAKETNFHGASSNEKRKRNRFITMT